MFKKLLTISTTLILLSSCSGDRAEKVEPLKRGDKALSCSDILLEINEAEFYKKQAIEKKQLGIKSIVAPLGYVGTYMSADEAIEATNSRVGYLNRIYEIKGCNPVEAEGGLDDAMMEKQLRANMQQSINSAQQQPQVIYTQPQQQQPMGVPVYQQQPNYGYGNRY